MTTGTTQVKELVDIIEAAESTIRTQLEETEQLKAALHAAELELQTRKNQGVQDDNHSPQASNSRSTNFQTTALRDGHPGMALPRDYPNGSAALTSDTPLYHNGHSNGGVHGGPPKSVMSGARSNGLPAGDTSSSLSPRMRRRDSETDIRRDYYQPQGLPGDMSDSNSHGGYHRSQEMVRVSRGGEEEDMNQVHLKGRLMEASIKEAQLVSEKRILERRVAELRLAYDQQQQGLVDAASKALSYRQNVLEENIRLTYALQVAEQERTTYVQHLMPLLADFDLQPPVSDAHSIVSHIKILVQKLRSELELYEGKVKDSQFYPQSYQPAYQPTSSYNPPPQSPPFQGHGMEIVPSYSQRPTSPAQQPRNGGPSWESASSSPHYGRVRTDDLHLAGSNDQDGQTDAGAIVPHDSVNSRGNEGLDDLEGDDSLYNGSHTHGDFGRQETVRSPSQLPPLQEEPSSPSFDADNDPLPGIMGLRIVGDAVLSGRLTACGHSINGTSLCIFQWVRHNQDGAASMIDGAAQPEYTITADDCDSMVAIECVPMDERGRRGDLVTVMANDGNWITQEPMMHDQIESYMTSGQASFEVSFLTQEGTSEDVSEPATLVLRRSNFELRRNNGRKILVNEKYGPDVSIKIPVGELLQCAIYSHDGRESLLELRDPRTRDTAVLTFRAFNKAALANDEQKKKTRRKWLRG